MVPSQRVLVALTAVAATALVAFSAAEPAELDSWTSALGQDDECSGGGSDDDNSEEDCTWSALQLQAVRKRTALSPEAGGRAVDPSLPQAAAETASPASMMQGSGSSSAVAHATSHQAPMGPSKETPTLESSPAGAPAAAATKQMAMGVAPPSGPLQASPVRPASLAGVARLPVASVARVVSKHSFGTVSTTAFDTSTASVPHSSAILGRSSNHSGGAPAAATTGERLIWLIVGEDYNMATLIMACLLYSLLCCAVIVAVAGFAYDVVGYIRLRARFRMCQKKVRHVHQAFHEQDHDLPLCHYCLEFVHSKPISSRVVFHCGHTFHMICANEYFHACKDTGGGCPTCEGALAVARAAQEPAVEAAGAAADASIAAARSAPTVGPQTKEADAVAQVVLDREVEAADNGGDESPSSPGSTSATSEEGRRFLAASLQRMYPELVSKALAQRWSSCHIEIWLSELVCPAYASVFKRRKGP
mmetsp:Transcript_66554/g.214486  ORF Transcript_66554/g.214486 Transcript_66554/m.214486 type:complete len:476 (-) Transcript_66554:69-1496(-)